MNTEKFQECYRLLINETENEKTIFNKSKHDTLSLLLDLFEYIQDNEDDNPLLDYFD